MYVHVYMYVYVYMYVHACVYFIISAVFVLWMDLFYFGCCYLSVLNE